MTKVLRRAIIVFGLLITLMILLVSTGYYYILSSNTTVTDTGIVFVREDSNSVNQVFEQLRRRGYIKNMHTLSIVSRLKKYESRVKPGRYRIQNGMNNNELVNQFRSGNQDPVQFTFNNMRTLAEFAEEASKDVETSKEELLSLLHNPEVIANFGFDSTTIVAMFIPNTYEMYWNTSAMDLLKRMKKEYDRFWNESRRSKASEIGLSPVDVTTLASIIEEETTKAEEFSIIAGVYINRLHQGMKLDACPTLKFVLGDFSLGRILERYTKIDSPYNTYMYAGLPPGPIRMTSIQVIDSVLNYQKHDYLFFCAKSDFSGSHNFSKTLRQHNIYAQEYHQELNKRKIWK